MSGTSPDRDPGGGETIHIVLADGAAKSLASLVGAESKRAVLF